MMRTIREILGTHRATFGSWFSVHCSHSAEKFGQIGFDWVILDLQHGFATWEGVLPLLQALELGGTPSLVRIHRHDPAEIGLALDLGAIGIVAPLVSTPEQARLVAEATRYPPRGTRSWGPNRHAPGSRGLKEDPFCIVMIETVEGLRHLDAIAATPGVDCLLLGGVDLGLSMGIGPGSYPEGNPRKVDEALDQMIAACRRNGKIAGNIALDHDGVEDMLSRGVRFLPIGVAHLFMLDAAKQMLGSVEPLRRNAETSLKDVNREGAQRPLRDV